MKKGFLISLVGGLIPIVIVKLLIYTLSHRGGCDMPIINADKIRGLIISNDELFIPDTITEAIMAEGVYSTRKMACSIRSYLHNLDECCEKGGIKW